jgi:hypothetical protein
VEPPTEPPPQILFKPANQIDNPHAMKVTFPKVSPNQAATWVNDSDADPSFHQRPLRKPEVRRWSLLMETDRFVEFFPGAPICLDHEGMLLNGKHRLTAVSEGQRSVGFMVVKNVPRWMFPYFDTGKNRTINDVFRIAGRMSESQTGSTMRLGMRYEEFLWGMRPPTNWKEWSKVKDEHPDVDTFHASRLELADLYMVADQCYRGSGLIIASLMVFRFYQSLAWPEGNNDVAKFFDQLTTGADMSKNSPPLVLREWSLEIARSKERILAKREMHLLLLNMAFAQSMRGEKIPLGRQRAAHGLAMRLPYHPDGEEVALDNVRGAMRKLSS